MTWRNIRSLSWRYWYSFCWFCLYWFWSLCFNWFLYLFYIFSWLWNFGWLSSFWFLNWWFFFLWFRYNWLWFWWTYSWFLSVFLLLCACRNTFFLLNNSLIDTNTIILCLSGIILNFFLILFYLNRRRLDFSFILIAISQSDNLLDLLVFRFYFILYFLYEFLFLSSLLVTFIIVTVVLVMIVIGSMVSVILISGFILWSSLLGVLSSCW